MSQVISSLTLEGKKVMRTTTTFLEPVRTEVNDIEIDETAGKTRLTRPQKNHCLTEC